MLENIILTPTQCDKFFKDLKHPRLRDLDPEEIFKIIINKVGGTLLFTIPFGKKIKELTVYRVTRKYNDLENNLTFPKSFSYPKSQRRNRANIEGNPVFYCSISPKIAIFESKEFNEEVYVSRWKIKFPTTVNASTLILHDNYPDNTYNKIIGQQIQEGIDKLFSKSNKKYKEWFRYQLKKFGDLFIINGDSYYHLSSAIANKILFDYRKAGAQIPILIYPSVIKESHDFNLAIYHGFADDSNFMELESVVQYQDTSDTKELAGTFKKKAIVKSGLLEWKNQQIGFKIDFNNVAVKLVAETDARLINPEASRIHSIDFDCSLKDYLLNKSNTIYDHVEKEFGIVGSNHDFFNTEMEYTGEIIVPFTFNNPTFIYITGDYLIEALGINVKYKISYI